MDLHDVINFNLLKQSKKIPGFWKEKKLGKLISALRNLLQGLRLEVITAYGQLDMPIR